MSGDEKNDIQLSDKTKARIEELVLEYAAEIVAALTHQMVSMANQLSLHQLSVFQSLMAKSLREEETKEERDDFWR